MKKYLLAFTFLIISLLNVVAQCPLDAPTINERDYAVCTPDTYTLTATVVSNVNYQWKLNGTAISGATNTAYTANTSGLYSVEISNGTCTSPTSPQVSFTVIQTPIANAGPDQYALANTLITLNPSGGELYSWSPTEGLSNPFTRNPTITILKTTEFIVKVADATNTCYTTDAVMIYVTNSTAVSKSLAQSGINLFPNPATESFNIEMPESDVAVSFEILDLTGASVATGNFLSSGNAEKIPAIFDSGMYQVVLRYNDVVTTGRLSKVQ